MKFKSGVTDKRLAEVFKQHRILHLFKYMHQDPPLPRYMIITFEKQVELTGYKPPRRFLIKWK